MIEKFGKGSISGSGTLCLLKERNCLFACMKSEGQLLNRGTISLEAFRLLAMGLQEGSSPVEKVDLLVPLIAFAFEVFTFALKEK